MRYPFSKTEKKWTKKWLDTRIYEPDLDKAKKPFYNLMMFPYPSAEGMHVGNAYAFTGSDIYGRYKRMQGHDVFEPIGLDGFGIHSENYALKMNTHPAEQAEVSEKRFFKQLQEIGNGFAWEERLATFHPDYYKWTQWIFIQMWKQGLVERKKSSVNWCPSCKTVLADEQVVSGRCERCSTDVTKKELEQWFFKITDYAEKLLGNLEKLDWSENIKIAQNNWIGKSEGALVQFPITELEEKIEIFTTRPDTIFGATYMVLAPEHPLVQKLENKISNKKAVEDYITKTKSKTENERIADIKSKTGVELKGVRALNPVNQKEIPIWIADYVLASYGTGAIMAVPGQDERDWEFAEEFKLPIVRTVEPPKNFKGNAYLEDGPAINSDFLDGLDINGAKVKIIKWLKDKNYGESKVNYHLRDWLISRQRYWGAPIPMIYCKKCDWQPAPLKDLPILLPKLKDFRPKGTGEAPLASSSAFYKTKCPKCKGPARRETDVSDTFLDSSWYFYRYINMDKKKEAFNKVRVKKWLPVDMYIGGAEHAVLHLLYSRFLAMAFKDMGLIDFEEPFTALRSHGMIIKEGAKMSKSKGNVVVPDEYIRKFGADTLRMYLMFIGPFQEGGDWRDGGITGIDRFLNRIWNYFESREEFSKKYPSASNSSAREEILPIFHQTIKKVGEDIEDLKYNTAISQLMILFNKMEEPLGDRKGPAKGFAALNSEEHGDFLKLLAPFTPFITEELWEKLGNKYSVHQQEWPEYKDKNLITDEISLIIQVNGKLRGTIQVAREVNEKEATEIARGIDSVKTALGKKKVKKTIFVSGRLINFVIN
ncbi:leucine--tRNA ligase [Patescibacteria group bacterium]|nr:leucine--tRNA ligase [Patescibacteria group bacterium]